MKEIETEYIGRTELKKTLLVLVYFSGASDWIWNGFRFAYDHIHPPVYIFSVHICMGEWVATQLMLSDLVSEIK